MYRLAQLASVVVVNPHDLGSSPRSSCFLNIIFPLTFTCSACAGDHHAPSKSSMPRVQLQEFKGVDCRNTIHVSQCASMLIGKVKWTQIIGPDYSRLHLHFGDYHPPRFAYFSLFFIFFIYLNLLLLIIICLN